MAYLGALSISELRLAHIIDAHIQRVLDATDQNKSATAAILGVNRRSLQRYVRRNRRRALAKRNA